MGVVTSAAYAKMVGDWKKQNHSDADPNNLKVSPDNLAQ
jgi:hypothetical protein